VFRNASHNPIFRFWEGTPRLVALNAQIAITTIVGDTFSSE
jgi:hypothetical protein